MRGIPLILSSASQEIDIPLEMAANHIASSLLALIEWWLAHDMPYTPEEMAYYYTRIISHLCCRTRWAITHEAYKTRSFDKSENRIQ